ncbi:histone PARylation factor 1 isoform X7 [Suricata suricatta]|nr:histone PARylation factor 1 isoform X7 [Suricata suricatta]
MKKLKEVTDKKKTSLLKNIDEKLTEAARELGYSLEQRTVKMKQRDKKVVTKTFHGAGLVVPVDKNDVGYRELPETDANLKKICKTIVEAPSDEDRLKAFAPIQEMMTFVQFANDECDYGMGLELGIDLFCYGSHYFHKVAGQLLPLAYNLLKRNLFAEIIEHHLANRINESKCTEVRRRDPEDGSGRPEKGLCSHRIRDTHSLFLNPRSHCKLRSYLHIYKTIFLSISTKSSTAMEVKRTGERAAGESHPGAGTERSSERSRSAPAEAARGPRLHSVPFISAKQHSPISYPGETLAVRVERTDK